MVRAVSSRAPKVASGSRSGSSSPDLDLRGPSLSPPGARPALERHLRTCVVQRRALSPGRPAARSLVAPREHGARADGATDEPCSWMPPTTVRLLVFHEMPSFLTAITGPSGP